MGGWRHDPAALPPWKRLGTRCTAGWMCHRDGVDGCGNVLPTGTFFRYSLVFCTSSVFVSVLIVLHFAFFSLLTTHNTNIHERAGLEPTTPSSDRSQTLALENSATEDSIPGPPTVRSKSLYRLSYPSPKTTGCPHRWTPGRSDERQHPNFRCFFRLTGLFQIVFIISNCCLSFISCSWTYSAANTVLYITDNANRKWPTDCGHKMANVFVRFIIRLMKGVLLQLYVS